MSSSTETGSASLHASGSTPFFSIITCTLNSAEYLSETIASVHQQDYKNFEHIFIDGFSTDDTINIIKRYQGNLSSVRLYQIQPQGISNAMNYGIEKSRGEVILHLHSDDCLSDPQVLSLVHTKFSEKNLSMLVGNCCLMESGRLRTTWPDTFLFNILIKYFLASLMFYINPIPHPSTYIKKKVFTVYGGFDESLKVVMDYEAWFRFLQHEDIIFFDRILSKYRFHSQTVSTLQADQGVLETKYIRKNMPHCFLRHIYFL